MTGYYIGLMSGTSMDGIDAVLAEFHDSSIEVLATNLEPGLLQFPNREVRVKEFIKSLMAHVIDQAIRPRPGCEIGHA